MPFNIGNKTDVADETADTASLFGLVRSIIARLVTAYAAIGALTDAASEAAGASAIALLRALLARWTVPATDAIVNVDTSDVVGSKADAANVTTAQASVVGLLRAALNRFYGGTVTVYPAAAAGAAVTSGGADTWDGAAAELVAAAAIAVPYKVTSLTLHTPSAGMVGIVRLAHGAGPTTFFESAFAFESDAGPCIRMKLDGEGGTIPANARVVAIVKTVTGGETLAAHVGTAPAETAAA